MYDNFIKLLETISDDRTLTPDARNDAIQLQHAILTSHSIEYKNDSKIQPLILQLISRY